MIRITGNVVSKKVFWFSFATDARSRSRESLLAMPCKEEEKELKRERRKDNTVSIYNHLKIITGGMAGKKIKLKVITPEGVLFKGEVLHVVLPGEVSPFAVYPSHAPMISSTTAGEIKYVEDEQRDAETIEVGSGFAEINDDNVIVCVE